MRLEVPPRSARQHRLRRPVAVVCAAVVCAAGLIAGGLGPAPASAATLPIPLHGCPPAGAGAHFDAPGTGRTVALTFDDGPGRSTAQVLRILTRYKVTATFFNIGEQEASDPAAVRAEQHSGYALGDHTWDHATLTLLSPADQASEIRREASTQARITGSPPCLLRPPGGRYDQATLAAAHAARMQLWYWSVDTEDWKAAGSGDPYWVARIATRAEDGATQQHPVILMHNMWGGNPATVAALPSIITYYQQRHYRFVDLYGYSGPPSVTGLSRASAPTAGGVRVTVHGVGLAGVLAVWVGATRARFRLAGRSLVVTVPAHRPGLVQLRVVSTHGTSPAGPASSFRYTAAPPSPPPPTGGTTPAPAPSSSPVTG